MPFAFDSFRVEEKTLAFALLMRRYNIEMRDAQKIIDKGRLLCNGETIIKKNENIAGEIKVLRFMPKSRGLAPIFKTDNFMVFDKPSGVLVHPNRVLTPYSILDEVRHFGNRNSNSVHRIDMETSGLVLASIHRKCEIRLKTMFEQKKIKKSYLAWVTGNTPEQFSVDAPIKVRDDYSFSKHKVTISSSGKSAYTEFTKLLYKPEIDASLLSIKPFTGRTHQIRIHLFHMKHPILGDPLYSTDYKISEAYLEERLTKEERIIYTGAERLLLHANTLEFTTTNKYYIKSNEKFDKKYKLIAVPKIRKLCFT